MKNLKFVFGLVLSALIAFTIGSLTHPIVGVTLFSAKVLMAFAPNISGLALVNILDPTDLTWNGKEAKAFSEAIMENVYSNPMLTSLHIVKEGIVAREQIAFLGTLSKITKAKTTCGGSAGAHGITMSEKFWDPARVEFWLDECADNLEESFVVWGLNNGYKRKDLTNTEYNVFISERIETALAEDALRIVWFNDTAHEDVDASPAGVLTSGTDLTDYTIIDGLWSQIYDVVALDADRKISISRNAQASYATQVFLAADTTNKVAHSILQDMIDGADDRLKDAANKAFYVTGSIYDQYKKELKNYTSIEAAYEMTQSGVKQLMFDGIPVIPIRFWDRTIKADFDNGTTWYQPHRAVLTVKENIPVGVDEAAALAAIENWYERKDQKTNWRGGYKIDAKVLESYMIQVAY